MIDRRISYDNLKGLETILRLKGTDNRTAAKPTYDKRKYKKLNGNVFELPVSDEWWLIKEKEEEEKDDDKESGRKKSIKLTSVDKYILQMEYWFDRWQEHPFKNKFKTLKDFISYSLSEEDQPTFNKGGLVNSNKGGLASLARILK